MNTMRKLLAVHMALLGMTLTVMQLSNAVLKGSIMANEAQLKRWGM